MRATVLLSGGLDSAVVLARAIEAGDDVTAVCVDYGQPHVSELTYALAFASERDVPIRRIRVGNVYPDREVEGANVFRGRNAVLIALAAAAVEADEIRLGCNADDQRDYVDCRPAFLRAIGQALDVRVVAPLVGMTKAEVVLEATRLRIDPIENTLTCYRGVPGGCGTCAACDLLGRAIKEAARCR